MLFSHSLDCHACKMAFLIVSYFLADTVAIFIKSLSMHYTIYNNTRLADNSF